MSMTTGTSQAGVGQLRNCWPVQTNDGPPEVIVPYAANIPAARESVIPNAVEVISVASRVEP
jgi:hypothetical protein